jgi:hypothetical protein
MWSEVGSRVPTGKVRSENTCAAWPSRRWVLAAGIGFAASALAPPASVPNVRPRGELFAFLSPESRDPVIALAVEAIPSRAEATPLVVRLHAGASSWTTTSLAREDGDQSDDGVRRYAGRMPGVRGGESDEFLVAVAVPIELMDAGTTGVWAEIIDANGVRARVGNPVMSRVLDYDIELARMHAELAPHLEAGFAEPTVELIAQHLSGVSDRRAYADRLVSTMLPDTLCFDPCRPIGFTFAAMNGRRPEDQIRPIAQALLPGMSSRPERIAGVYGSSSRFPYIASTAA